MENISQFPDHILLKVLSFLPTKVAASTSVLSKRWEFLWMWLPKLDYDSRDCTKYQSYKLRAFIEFSLPLHRAPVIESLRLNFSTAPGYPKSFNALHIEKWVLIAVSRCVRELSLEFYPLNTQPVVLPSSLYICKSLVTLELTDNIMVVVPRVARLPSLKTLILRRVWYSDAKSLGQILSISPLLEDLVVERNQDNDKINPLALSVIVPSLQRLTLNIAIGSSFDGLVINTPSLKYFKVKVYRNEVYYARDSDHQYESYSYDFEEMPKLEEADIESSYPDINKFVRSISYVKRLSLCICVNAEEALYGEGIVFNQLQHLKLCSCYLNWSILLVRLLKDSPNLRELHVYLKEDHTRSCLDPLVCWEDQLDCVPECLLTSLETFKWTGISGSQEEIDLVKYILRNACFLKTATILFRDKQEMMIQELSLCVPSSTACQLFFG
ncbi:unnamed protein product [Microthlaspi erraticum]|uniref:FBD domain-containing protein n=1 Tax=Microthlaspi erraticum TaxID=1685480 RepID=A0A6D2K157_9BRAS|nr:unnamed protein product [Microthlaspi erraticum]